MSMQYRPVSTDVHAVSAGQVNGKGLHGFFEFEPAAADIAQALAADFDDSVLGKGRAGLVFFLIIYIDNACHDQGFGLLAGRGKPLLC